MWQGDWQKRGREEEEERGIKKRERKLKSGNDKSETKKH
jgi:hypothetical protein